jgi:hypothetical protein
VIGRFLEYIGILVITIIAGCAGAFAAIWILERGSDPSYGLSLPTLLPRVSSKPCLAPADRKAMATFTALLLDTRPIEANASQLEAELAKKLGPCSNVVELLKSTCDAVEGGNARDKGVCSRIEVKPNESPKAEPMR